MRPRLAGLLTLAMAIGAANPTVAADLLEPVSVRPAFFNPTLGQAATVTFHLPRAGRVTLTILDRDSYVIRTLPAEDLPAGDARLTWDGKDQRGVVVPNEAYCVNLRAEVDGRIVEYAPSRDFRGVLSDPKRSYSMVSGVLRYELPGPSRVHIQAGEAVLVGDPKEGKRDGPVLKTIVDREPRTGGVVVETWDGYDESRTVHIPSLKNFAISILGESLPPATMITVGSRSEGFRQYAARTRKGKAPLYPRSRAVQMPGMQHEGLSALEDYSPALTLAVDRARKDSQGRLEVDLQPLVLKAQIPSGAEKLFTRAEGSLDVFVDERKLFSRPGATNPASLSIPSSEIPAGEHRVTVNWISSHGPVSAQVIRVIRRVPVKEAAK